MPITTIKCIQGLNVEGKTKKILIVNPGSPQQRGSLEVLARYLQNYTKEEIIEAPDLSAYSPLNPDMINMVLYCSNEPSAGDLLQLRKNHRIPVLGVLASEKMNEPELIEKFNYFSASASLDNKTDQELTKKMSDALTIKAHIDWVLHNRMLSDVSKSLEEEIAATKEGKITGDPGSVSLRHPPRTISTFEALYNILAMQREDEIIKIDTEIREKLILRVVPYLKQLEKSMLEKPGLDHEIEHYRKIATTELTGIIQKLNDKKNWQWFRKIIQYRVGGSTIAEEGSRYLFATSRKKYTEKEAEEAFFLRDIQERKGMSAETITNIRYLCSRIQPIRCAKILPHVYCEDAIWILEEGLLGQNLAWVMARLWERINSSEEKEKKRYLRIKDALEKRYMDNLISWQKRTRKVPQGYPDAQNAAEKIAESFGENLALLSKIYLDYKVLSEKECILWTNGLGALTHRNLGITKKKTVLSLDASARNVMIHILQNNASLDEILAEITDNGEPAEEKINTRFYHVDTGFAPTHCLEDFFHIVDAYETADINAKPAEVLKQLKEKYKYFCENSGLVYDLTELYLVGVYRNLRRAYLLINEFSKKNKEWAMAGELNEYAYNRDRKSYISQHAHHASRAAMYLKELQKHFSARMGRNNGGFAEIDKEYDDLNQKLRKECLSEDVIIQHIAWFDKLEKMIPEYESRRKRRYLCSILYTSMSSIMSKLSEKLIGFEALPKYKALVIEDASKIDSVGIKVEKNGTPRTTTN